MHRFAELFVLAPKILPVDITMREPQGAMMLMFGLVRLELGDGFHRPISGHVRSARPNQRITIRARNILEKILRKQLAVNLDPQPITQLRDLNAFCPATSGTLVRAKRKLHTGEKKQGSSKMGSTLA